MKRLLENRVFWGVFSRIVNMAGGFLLLPLLVHYLNKELLSLYYLFISLTMLTSILDFGFNATLTRNFSYAYAGAQRIVNTGICNDFQSGINWKLIGEIFIVSRAVYFIISAFSMLIFFIPCSFYIYHLSVVSHLDHLYAIKCWLLFSASSILALYFNYYSALIQGRGDVNLANKINIISKLCGVAISVITLVLGYNLIGVCISNLSTCIVERLLYRKYSFNDDRYKSNILKSLPWEKILANIKILSTNSIKYAAVAIGGYLVTRATVLIAVNYLGLVESASYILSIQLITIITGISATLIGVYVPKLNMLATQPMLKLQIFCFANVISILTYIVLGTFLIFAGHYCLLIIHAKTTLLGNQQLIVLLIIYLLEVQHGNFACLITTDNQVPFVKAAVYSGLSTVILAVLFVKYLHLSVWGIIVAQGVTQLFYNNWFWIYYVCKEYKINYFDTFKLAKQYVFEKL